MRAINGFVFRAVCAMIVGILLVANPESMTLLLVQVIGGLFSLSGVVSLVNYLMVRYSDTVLKPIFPIVGFGSMCFGVFLFFFPHLFTSYFMYMLGALMVLAGGVQLWNAFRWLRTVSFRWSAFVMALLILSAGVYVLLEPLQSASLPFVILGVAFLLYGLTELVNGMRWVKYRRLMEEQRQAEEAASVPVIENPEEK